MYGGARGAELAGSDARAARQPGRLRRCDAVPRTACPCRSRARSTSTRTRSSKPQPPATSACPADLRLTQREASCSIDATSISITPARVPQNAENKPAPPPRHAECCCVAERAVSETLPHWKPADQEQMCRGDAGEPVTRLRLGEPALRHEARDGFFERQATRAAWTASTIQDG